MSEPVIIGDATLYCGDCLEILPTLGKVDAVVTDPPYGTEDLGGGYGRRQNHDPQGRFGRRIAGDRDLQAVSGLFRLIPECMETGWCLVFYAARKTPEFIEIARDMEWFGNVVWVKAPGLGYHIRYSHEDIAIFRVGKPKRPAQPLLSVISQPRVSDLHPHEKPVKVMERLCKWASTTTVADPFMGSGTTGVACANLGRKFIGIEIDRGYFDIACERIDAAYRQQRLFE